MARYRRTPTDAERAEHSQVITQETHELLALMSLKDQQCASLANEMVEMEQLGEVALFSNRYEALELSYQARMTEFFALKDKFWVVVQREIHPA